MKPQKRPYEKNQVHLIMSAFDFDDKYLDFLRHHEKDFRSKFCSEFVTLVYQKLNLFDENSIHAILY